MKNVFIYGLCSSDDNIIRYVGKCSDIEYRLKMHYSQRNSSKTHKNNWINYIIKKGCKLKMIVLEEVSEKYWQNREIYWISKFENLTNTSSGGKGGSGKKYTISYNDAKNIIISFKIKSKSEWVKFTKLDSFPNFIPKSPSVYFSRSWISWGDFLGTNRISDNKIVDKYMPYSDAKKWINENLNIKTIREWKKGVINNIIPEFIPNRPNRFYKKRGWESWTDFLSKERIANQKRKIFKYEKAKMIINELNIQSIKEYKNIQSQLYKNDLPVHPHLTYKNKGFTNYEEFFKRL